MKILFVLLGPTGVGKTALSIHIARHIHSPVISADSRQIYKDMSIGTAAPTPAELSQVKHYFIGTHSVTDYYSASMFEEEALSLMDELFRTHSNLLLCGGSMLYIDAVCKGIDEMPTVTQEVRNALWAQYSTEGLESIREELKKLDPVHYEQVDRMNYRRVIHALEVCKTAGRPYSSFRNRQIKTRPFQICKIGLTRDRADIYARINQRVDAMIENGFIEEAERLYPMRHANALNTLGYKEMFAYFSKSCSLEDAIEKMKKKTRDYSRKQMTWFKRDPEITWFNPDNEEDILAYIHQVAYENT